MSIQPAVASESTIRCVADVHAVLGEGPVWDQGEESLYWVDIKGRKIFRLDSGRVTEWPTPLRVGSIAPRMGGGLIAGTDEGIAQIDLDAGRFEVIDPVEPQLPDNRFNDGKVDRQGRFWAGTMDDREREAVGTLYRLQRGAKPVAVDVGYRVTNGPAFSPAGDTMYHNDSARQVTYAFDLDDDGNASNRRTFLQFGDGDGFPDGMTVDAEGCLWIAFWDGWCIRRFSPEGERLETIRMPIAKPTSCAFGGLEMDELYVTSASIGLDEDALEMQPNAGGLFMVTPGVRGLVDVPYAG